MYPHTSPGRGECASGCAEKLTYVWAHNNSAVIGVAICALLLISWFKYVRPSLYQGEDVEEDA